MAFETCKSPIRATGNHVVGMGRVCAARKRTSLQASADRHSVELAKRAGKMLRDARRAWHRTQAQASARAGLSQSAWSRLELGDPRASLATWDRAAFAAGGSLNAFVRQASAADEPRDAVHLRHQELVIRTALAGGWRSLPEEPIDREARTSRAADVILHRKREYAIVEVWDWFDDVGAALRDFDRRLDALERFAIARMTEDVLPLTSGCWVVRATQRNRRLLHGHRNLFQARFPGSGHAWLAAIRSASAAMPREPAFLWVTIAGDRLFPARLG
jgi:transcriptional regulator with XRE-family HTH domain